MYQEYLALNSQQWLICHKTKPNQTNPFCVIPDCAQKLFQLISCSEIKRCKKYKTIVEKSKYQ